MTNNKTFYFTSLMSPVFPVDAFIATSLLLCMRWSEIMSVYNKPLTVVQDDT
jgi:hypothetical protein